MKKEDLDKSELAAVVIAIVQHHMEDLETALEDIFDADFIGRRLGGQVSQEVKAAYLAAVRGSVDMIHEAYKEELDDILAKTDQSEERLNKLEKELKKDKT